MGGGGGGCVRTLLGWMREGRLCWREVLGGDVYMGFLGGGGGGGGIHTLYGWEGLS